MSFFGDIAGNFHLGGHLAFHLSGVFVLYCVGIGLSVSCWDESIAAPKVMSELNARGQSLVGGCETGLREIARLHHNPERKDEMIAN